MSFTTVEKQYEEAIHFLKIREHYLNDTINLHNRNDILRAISNIDMYFKNHEYWLDIVSRLNLHMEEYDSSPFRKRLDFLKEELAKHKKPEIIKCPNCCEKYDLNDYKKCPECGKENV